MTHKNGTKNIIIVHVSLLIVYFQIGFVLVEQAHGRVNIALYSATESLNIAVNYLDPVQTILLHIALE